MATNTDELLGPARRLLAETSTSELCKPDQEIITLRQNLSIGDAMQVTCTERGKPACVWTWLDTHLESLHTVSSKGRSRLGRTPIPQILAKRGILSAPIVVEPELEEFESLNEETELTPQLLGWLDISDVLRAFLERAWEVVLV